MPSAMGKSGDVGYDSVDEDDETLAIATRTRLPTGSMSPEKRWSQSPYPTGGGDYSTRFDKIKEESAEGDDNKAIVPTTDVEDTKNCELLCFD